MPTHQEVFMAFFRAGERSIHLGPREFLGISIDTELIDYKRLLGPGQHIGYWVNPNIKELFALVDDDKVSDWIILGRQKVLGADQARKGKNRDDELSAAPQLIALQALCLLITELKKVMGTGTSELFKKDSWGMMFVGNSVIQFGWDIQRLEWNVSFSICENNVLHGGRTFFSAAKTLKG